MNQLQKTILVIAAAAIVITSLFASWDLTGAPGHTNATRYRPIFLPPDMGVWSERSLSSSVPWTWATITLVSGLLFVAARDRDSGPRS